jgi:hypothetical protein
MLTGRGSNEPAAVSLPPPVIQDSTTVTIRTTPPNATVIIDGAWAGRSPIESRPVPAKEMPLRIELAGYRDYSDTLFLEKDTPVERAITLIERSGALRVTSTPEGANIYLDGENTGLVTPATFDNLAVTRRHTVQFRLAGFSTRTIEGAEVFEDSTRTLHHAFSKLTSPLTVVSRPEGAEVYLDGRNMGVTPRNLTSISHGTHTLELKKPGYAAFETTLEVPAPDHLFETNLTKLPPGMLIIQAQPYAELWINGELKEEYAVYLSLVLDAGTYQIELRHPQYTNISQTLTITSQDTVRFQHRFGEDAQ